MFRRETEGKIRDYMRNYEIFIFVSRVKYQIKFHSEIVLRILNQFKNQNSL